LVEQVLLALQVAFVVLLYLFIWRVVRVASRDLTVGQESMVLTPARPVEQAPARAPGRLLVAASPELEPGTQLEISRELVAGRDAGLDLSMPSDGYASGRHARFVRGLLGDSVEDLGSTNGTYVNGQRITAPTTITMSDTVRIGKTILKLEP
jgi:hypothetical protein